MIIGIYNHWDQHRTWLTINTTDPYFYAPSDITKNLLILEPENITKANEIETLPLSSSSEPIVEMIQTPDGRRLFVVYDDGSFRKWNLNNFQSEQSFDFLAADPHGVNFSEDGSLVITPGEILSTSELGGYTVWDTQTGGIVDCYGGHCPEDWPKRDIIKTGFALSPDSSWVIYYHFSVIDALGLDLRITSGWDIDPNPNDPFNYTINDIAFDPSGTYIACSTKEGQIYIFVVSYLFNPTGRSNEDILSSKDWGETTHVQRVSRHYGTRYLFMNYNAIDLAIDDTRKWLAQLTDKKLTLWDLSKDVNSVYFSKSFISGNVLAFDHTGFLLAVGSQDGITIYDLIQKKQIAFFNVGYVSDIYFSRDNRLMIWGDVEGNIHLWGVPQ